MATSVQNHRRRIVRHGGRLTLLNGDSLRHYYADNEENISFTAEELSLINAELQQINSTLKRLVMRADDQITRTESVAHRLHECREIIEDSNNFSRARHPQKTGDMAS